MIHYFNPGHEAAILHASGSYMPPKAVQEMRRDLSYLPAWYAAPDDFVLTEKPLPDDFRRFLQESFGKMATAITENDFRDNKEAIAGQSIDLWGIAPQSVRLFEQYSEQYAFNWRIPAWNDAFRRLSSRCFAARCLTFLIESLPEIAPTLLPRFFSGFDELETFVKNARETMLAKSPLSSSGRGLVWLPPGGAIARAERQILTGMLRKQGAVSVEKALHKVLDFSMHFEITNKSVRFLGYSIFQTSDKGAYQRSLLASQHFLEKEIKHIDTALLEKVKALVAAFLQREYMPVYEGCIGVDMLVYENEGKYWLQPCVEINMRKSMGYLAVMLHRNYLAEGAVGHFYCAGNVPRRQTPVVENGRLVSGRMALCPVAGDTRFCAYMEVC